MKKVAFITGASRGIGESIAWQLARDGYIVLINGTNEEKVKHVMQQLIANGYEAASYVGNVASYVEVQQMFRDVQKTYGQLDVLICNAGNLRDAKAIHMQATQWHEVIDVHVNGVFYCIEQALPLLMKRGGDILMMTSLAGLQGSKGQVNYSAAKAAQLGMIWTLAQELRTHRIRVNGISPAALTEMTKPVIDYVKAKCAARQEPFPDFWKIGRVEDVAMFVSALLRVEDADVTGEVFGVNGQTITKWEKPTESLRAQGIEPFFAAYKAQQRK